MVPEAVSLCQAVMEIRRLVVAETHLFEEEAVPLVAV
jgi:hypothetical protein